MRLPAFLRRLRDAQHGATVVEFAIVAPVMCLLLVGAFDISHTLYTRAMLQGIVQKTGRDSTLENADEDEQAILDERVRKQAKALVNNADIDIVRRYYRTFSDAAAARKEDFTDSKTGPFANGRCDGGEPYVDTNNNRVWDSDGGDGGQGGAKDKTVYTVTMTYKKMLPLPAFLGRAFTDTKIEAETVLANQPYGDQGNYAAPTVRNCP